MYHPWIRVVFALVFRILAYIISGSVAPAGEVSCSPYSGAVVGDDWRVYTGIRWRCGSSVDSLSANGNDKQRIAVWRYSDDAWELAAVATLPAYRRRG